jgi:hypothetical protein
MEREKELDKIHDMTVRGFLDVIWEIKEKKHEEAFKRILKRSIEKNEDLLTELQKR